MRAADLNYQHLRYFHTVAREGSVLRASRVLHLAPSTVSGQIKALEQELGRPLFERAGRALVLTPFGIDVLRYADEIFALGEGLVRFTGHGGGRQLVRVGVSSVLPKLLVRELLRSAFRDDVQLVIEGGVAEELLGALAARRLEVVLSDGEMPSWMAARAHSHLVIETGIAVFGSKAHFDIIGDRLPAGLGDVPWLVPPFGTSLRQGLERWWDEANITPDIAAVVHDSSLLKALADTGVGVFAAPERMRDAILAGYRVECVGTTQQVMERIYAITRDEDPQSGAVRAICGLPPREPVA